MVGNLKDRVYFFPFIFWNPFIPVEILMGHEMSQIRIGVGC